MIKVISRRTGSKFFAIVLAVCFIITYLPSGINEAKAASKTVEQKLAERDFPSVHQAWNPIIYEKPYANENQNIAAHDIYWRDISDFGLQWNNIDWPGLSDGFVSNAPFASKKATLEGFNPNIIILAEVRWYSCWDPWVPKDGGANDFWIYENGARKSLGGYPQWFLDYKDPNYRAKIAAQAKAIVEVGFEGVFLDCFAVDGDSVSDQDPDRIKVLQAVRAAIDEVNPNALLIINSNQFKVPNAAQYINGMYMECGNSNSSTYCNAAFWQRVSETYQWAEQNLRTPTANCVEMWYEDYNYTSAASYAKMRATMTMTMTQGSGFGLFCQSNGGGNDHKHRWYGFFTADLGKPVRAGFQLPNGLWQREFEKGTVVYNPKGNGSQSITFAEQRTSFRDHSDETTNTTINANTPVNIPEMDGRIFLYDNNKPATIPEPAHTIIKTTSFGSITPGTQGVNNWYFKTYSGGAFTNMQFDSGGPSMYRMQSGGAYVFGENSDKLGEIDVNSSTVCSIWKAPSAGSVTATGSLVKPDASSNGIKFWITKNDTTIYDEQVVSAATTITPNVTIDVAAGDEIRFFINNNGVNDGYTDRVMWYCETRQNMGTPQNSSIPAVSSSPPPSSSAPPPSGTLSIQNFESKTVGPYTWVKAVDGESWPAGVCSFAIQTTSAASGKALKITSSQSTYTTIGVRAPTANVAGATDVVFWIDTLGCAGATGIGINPSITDGDGTRFDMKKDTITAALASQSADGVTWTPANSAGYPSGNIWTVPTTGYKGYIKIPLSSFVYSSTSSDPTADHIIDYLNISDIMFGLSMPSSGYYCVDDVSFAAPPASSTPPSSSSQPAVTVSSISMKSNPAKTGYLVGQDLDLAGAQITVNYSDSTTEDIAVTSGMVTGYDKTTAGTQTLTVTYSAKTTAFNVTVRKKGDINGDGNVTAADALMALQTVSGRRTLNDLEKYAADVNGDGNITAVDALKILQFASGRITFFE